MYPVRNILNVKRLSYFSASSLFPLAKSERKSYFFILSDKAGEALRIPANICYPRSVFHLSLEFSLYYFLFPVLYEKKRNK
jgi:hypothetical protein